MIFKIVSLFLQQIHTFNQKIVKIYILSMLICTIKSSMKSYRGMRTIQLQYIQLNFHFSQDIVLLWEQSLSHMPYGGGRNNTDASKLLRRRFKQKNMNNNLIFFRDGIEIFIISLFETRSKFVSSISRTSRRDWKFAFWNLEFREGGEK